MGTNGAFGVHPRGLSGTSLTTTTQTGIVTAGVTRPIFDAGTPAKKRVILGYFDADGYPYFSRVRNQVSVKAISVNKAGPNSMKEL